MLFTGILTFFKYLFVYPSVCLFIPHIIFSPLSLFLFLTFFPSPSPPPFSLPSSPSFFLSFLSLPLPLPSSPSLFLSLPSPLLPFSPSRNTVVICLFVPQSAYPTSSNASLPRRVQFVNQQGTRQASAGYV